MRAWLPAKTRAYLLCRAPAGVLKLAFSVVFFSFFLTNSAKFIYGSRTLVRFTTYTYLRLNQTRTREEPIQVAYLCTTQRPNP